MKFTELAPLVALVGTAFASPTPTIEKANRRTINKRAAITDAAELGYASTNGGTTGGAGGTTTTVSDVASFSTAAKADGAAVIVISSNLSGADNIHVSSDKTIVGTSGITLDGVGLYIKDASNVIVRNLAIANVLADTGDAIGIDASTNVWIDHVDLSSDLDHDKDYYDGLFDVKHGADWITISNSYLHDHWKTSLVGHSDSNADEDTGHLHVTYANVRWENFNSRGPSVRFGTAHIYNNYYTTIGDTGINTRQGAEVLVESTTFVDSDSPIVADYSDTTGYATLNDVDLGGGENTAPAGSITSADIPYDYDLVGSASADSATSDAGNTLSF